MQHTFKSKDKNTKGVNWSLSRPKRRVQLVIKKSDLGSWTGVRTGLEGGELDCRKL